MTNFLPENAVPFRNVYTVDVTPELAKTWLEGNRIDRPVLDRYVNQFSQAMSEGRWRLTHQGIAFAEDGSLIDGRHRLLAVIHSGVTVPMLVIINEPVENVA